jgi:hypothetical protein
MKSSNRISIFLIIGIVILAAFSRIIPHIPNVTPIAAMAIFSGAFVSRRIWLAIFIPIASLFISDLVLNNTVYSGFYDGFKFFGMTSVYLSIAIAAFGATSFLKNYTFSKVASYSLASSVIFFILTNFETWLTGGIYPKTVAGLQTCFIAAIPFFKNSLLGDLGYSALFFGLIEWVKYQYPKLSFSA